MTNSSIFDVCIIGLGVAGSLATLKLAKNNKNLKILGIESGPAPAKRRAPMNGWLGLLPFSDGKLYQSDLSKIIKIVNAKKVTNANNYFNNILKNLDNYSIIKDKSVNKNLKNKLIKNNYKIENNDYIQMYPKEIHLLSKLIAAELETDNITLTFNNEVQNIYKQKGLFIISTEFQEFKAKKIILATGRSGWRWANNLYSKFGIIDNNDFAKFGICLEINEAYMKDFNKSTCLLRKNNIEVGPFSWNGTIIPEDHEESCISSFRSNEDRWLSDKVFFNLIGNIEYPNNGFEQNDRLANLTFILTNERIAKEKITTFINNKSKISIISEYNWMKDALLDLNNIIPDLLDKGYFHFPTIIPQTASINIGSNLETDIDGMFVCGESANIPGLLGAAVSGIICADCVCK